MFKKIKQLLLKKNEIKKIKLTKGYYPSLYFPDTFELFHCVALFFYDGNTREIAVSNDVANAICSGHIAFSSLLKMREDEIVKYLERKII